MIGSAISERTAPSARPMRMPSSVSSMIWNRKCVRMRALVAPRLRSVAIERCRSMM